MFHGATISNSFPVEAVLPNTSPASFDFDAIYSMFPTRDSTIPNSRFTGDVAFDADLPDDPLFGLMDVSNMPFEDMPDPFSGGMNDLY